MVLWKKANDSLVDQTDVSVLISDQINILSEAFEFCLWALQLHTTSLVLKRKMMALGSLLKSWLSISKAGKLSLLCLHMKCASNTEKETYLDKVYFN